MTTPQIAQWRDGERDRAFRRFDVKFRVLLNPHREDASSDTANTASQIQALVTNISMSGLGLMSNLEVAIGAVLEVDIQINSQQFQLPVIVSRCDMIRRSRRVVYGCGVQYMRSESAADFIPALANYLTGCGALKNS